jgi:hypothetical protein
MWRHCFFPPILWGLCWRGTKSLKDYEILKGYLVAGGQKKVDQANACPEQAATRLLDLGTEGGYRRCEAILLRRSLPKLQGPLTMDTIGEKALNPCYIPV